MWREAIKSIGKFKQGQGTMECFPAIQQKHRNNQSLRFIENTPQLQVHCEFKIKSHLKASDSVIPQGFFTFIALS